MKLSSVKPGTKVKIKSFENHEIILKLMEMGCLPEEEILVWKKAPLGDPIYIMVSGYSLSLRLDEADQIIVETIVTV
jgi:ferrous iron transport protein A